MIGGAKYEGDYTMGNKDGVGKYTYTNGAYYEGQWMDNKIQGLGI